MSTFDTNGPRATEWISARKGALRSVLKKLFEKQGGEMSAKVYENMKTKTAR